MSVLESKIEADVQAYCKKNGVMCEKLRLASESGWPDRTLLYKGRVKFLELKKQGEKPVPLQAFIMERLTMRGFPAFWADKTELAITIIKGWMDHVDTR